MPVSRKGAMKDASKNGVDKECGTSVSDDVRKRLRKLAHNYCHLYL